MLSIGVMNYLKTVFFNTFSLTLIFILLLVQFLSFYQSNPPITEVQAAVINPPPPGPTSRPSPNQPYNVSPQLEQRLSEYKIQISPVPTGWQGQTDGITATQTLGGRTWNTWETNQEMDYITSVDYLSDQDMIIIAAVTGGVILTSVTIAFVGPAVASIAMDAAGASLITWANAGVVGAISAGSITLASRFQALPAFFRGTGGLALGISDYLTCKVVTQSECLNYVGVPSYLYFSQQGGIVTKQLVEPVARTVIAEPAAKRILPQAAMGIASIFGYSQIIGTESNYGLVLLNNARSTVLKMLLRQDSNDITRQALEAQSLRLASGLEGVPTFIRTLTTNDLPDFYRQIVKSQGVPDDAIIAIEMSYLPGESIASYVQRGGQFTPQMRTQALELYNEIIKRTGRGLGDHYLVQGQYHQNNIRIMPGNKIGYIDFGGDVLADPGPNLNFERILFESVWDKLLKYAAP